MQPRYFGHICCKSSHKRVCNADTTDEEMQHICHTTGLMGKLRRTFTSVSGLSASSGIAEGTAPEAVRLMCEDGGQM